MIVLTKMSSSSSSIPSIPKAPEPTVGHSRHRSEGGGLEGRLTAHVWPEGLGDDDSAVIQLVLLHDGDECSAGCDRSGVQTVCQRLLGMSGDTISDVESSGLIIRAIGA